MTVSFGLSEVSHNADPLEIKLAGEVQKLLLPKSSPLCKWCRMAAKSRMANVVGGDFYDFIELENGCQILLLGDVTGHGLHASLVMALVYGFIHRAAQQDCSPREVVTDLNTFLRSFAQRSERLDHFFSATLFFGVIEPESKRMSYINAGHPAGLVKRGEELMRLPATSHPVGYFEQTEFHGDTFQFADHDRLLLYTDGVIDSSNPQGEMFGAERLEKVFRTLEGDGKECLDRLFSEVRSYLNGQALFDDCTAIVIDFHDALTEEGD